MEWIVVSVLIGVAIVMTSAVQIVRMGLEHEEKRMALKAGMGEAGRLEQILAANEAELAKMRQRIEVLERLATDDERRLSREISGLHAERTSV